MESSNSAQGLADTECPSGEQDTVPAHVTDCPASPKDEKGVTSAQTEIPAPRCPPISRTKSSKRLGERTEASGEACAGLKRGGNAQKRQRQAQRTPSDPSANETAQADQNSEDEIDCPKDREIKRLQHELAEQKAKVDSMHSILSTSRTLITESLKQIAMTERGRAKESLFREELRVGKYSSPAPFGQFGAWEGGTEAEVIDKLKVQLRQERDNVESLRNSRKKQSKNRVGEVDGAIDAIDVDDVDDETREVCNHRAEFLRRHEALIKEKENKLTADRKLHYKHYLLTNAERVSSFRHYPLLQNRFQLLNMIGKGGNSDVFKAYDLASMSECAVKLHEIDAKMTEHDQANFVRLATREIEIHKRLQHPRIVQMLHFFPVSNTVLATALELCKGETLDIRLLSGPLPEKEAKSIIVQVLHGLRYLNSNGRQIIHYDIKPANIFYHCGEVKIGDFGLSKIADYSPGGMIELSTRGAGTRWYLPPECYESGIPKINCKVDVWSTGVLFYELLFQRKPFGHGVSQDDFMQLASTDSTFDLNFPSSPKVTSEAKEFLNRLLIKSRDQRPDVSEALADPYLRKK